MVLFFSMLLLLIQTCLWSILENVKRQTRNCGSLHPKKMLCHQRFDLRLRSCFRSNWNCRCKWIHARFWLIFISKYLRLTRRVRSMETKKHSLWLVSWEEEERPTLASTDFSVKWTSSLSNSEHTKSARVT